MPTDYTLERTHGRQTVFIHAADLYLLVTISNIEY